MALALTSDDKILISCSSDNTIKIWDVENRTMIHHFLSAHGGKYKNA